LYANGDAYNDWSKHGKVFATIRNLKLHLTSIERYINDNCVVINVLTGEEFPIKSITDNPENFK